MGLEQVTFIYFSYQLFDYKTIVVLFSVHDGFEVDSSNVISSVLDWN